MARHTTPLLLLGAAAFILLLLPEAGGFAVGPGPQQPQQQRPAPTSPYERRDRPASSADADEAAAAAEATAPVVLGPGCRVAVAGADSGILGRLVTKKLFQSQQRPYLLVPSLAKLPSGLGLDQYKVGWEASV